MVTPTVNCPHPACRRPFNFAGQLKCPHCHATFGDGVPLAPQFPGLSLLDRIFSSRARVAQVQREQAEKEFRALYDSWQQESIQIPQAPSETATRFYADLKAVLSRHDQIVAAFKDDIEKFLYASPIRLAKYEGEYSWRLEEALAKEIGAVVDGVLNGRESSWYSLGFIARCHNRFPNSYSRTFLTAELRHRFYQRRSVPRPGFQLTLEYARTLDGAGFEDWLARLLRDAGVPGVCKTQASRDQGADIVVTAGTRKIVLQAKNYQDTTGNKAVQEALGALHYYQANEAWVVTTSNFSADAIDLAFHTGVHLVDGSRLLNLPDLLRGAVGAAAHEPALPQHSQAMTTLKSSQSISTIPGTETTHAIPTALNNFGNGEAISDYSVTVPHSSGQLARTPFLRNWRLVAVGAGLILIFAAFAVYRARDSRRQTDNQQRIEESSEVGIQGLLGSYLSAERSRNPQLLANCFAPEVDTFYLHHNVSRDDVLHEFQRIFGVYSDVQMIAISRITFVNVTESMATATFDKEWDFRGAKSSAGSEREEMIFRKIDGSWRIVSERELKIYWTRRSGL